MRKYVSHKHKQRYGCTSKISFLQMSVLLKVKNESTPPKRLQSSRRLPILSWHRERMHLTRPTHHIPITSCLKIIFANLSVIFFISEYSCAMKSHFRKFGNQMSGSGNHLCNYASLLA